MRLANALKEDELPRQSLHVFEQSYGLEADLEHPGFGSLIIPNLGGMHNFCSPV